MPNPTPSDVHVDRPLTNIAVAYVQDAKDYIADRVFPDVPVQKQSDRYFSFSKGDLLRDEAQERAPGTESAGGGVSIDNTPTYSAKVYAYHEDIDDQMAANADSPLVPRRDSTENIMTKLLIKRDRLWADAYFKKTVWDKDWDGVGASPSTDEFLQWNDSSADPMLDIEAAKEVVRGVTGYTPNKLVVGASAFAALKNNPQVLDRIKYTQKGVITAELLAGLFDLDEVLPARAVYNSAAEGATAVVADIFGKAALLIYAAPSPGIRRPSGGYSFSWVGMTGAGKQGIRMKRFRMDHLESDRIEGEMAFDQAVIGSDLGLFMATAIA